MIILSFRDEYYNEWEDEACDDSVTFYDAETEEEAISWLVKRLSVCDELTDYQNILLEDWNDVKQLAWIGWDTVNREGYKGVKSIRKHKELSEQDEDAQVFRIREAVQQRLTAIREEKTLAAKIAKEKEAARQKKISDDLARKQYESLKARFEGT